MRTEKLPTGFLRGEAHVTRVGVFTYRNADGSLRRELRHPDDVFHPDSLRSLALAPITLGHPAEAVTSKNAKGLAVGAVGGEVARADAFVRAPFVVHDEAAIAEVESGRQRELSCGYDCRLDAGAGVYNGEAYDCRQRDIRYNHVAILSRGRAGPEVSIRLDGDDAVCLDSNALPARKETPMIKIRIDGVDFEVSETCAQAFTVHSTRKDAELAAAVAAVAAHKADADKALARADAADAELVKAKDAASPAKIADAVKARVTLEGQALKVLGAETKLDGLTDDEIHRAVVVKVAPSADLTGKSADYVRARFDHALETHGATSTDASKSVETVRTAAVRTDGVAAGDVAKTAHQRMVERHRAAATASAKA